MKNNSPKNNYTKRWALKDSMKWKRSLHKGNQTGECLKTHTHSTVGCIFLRLFQRLTQNFCSPLGLLENWLSISLLPIGNPAVLLNYSKNIHFWMSLLHAPVCSNLMWVVDLPYFTGYGGGDLLVISHWTHCKTSFLRGMRLFPAAWGAAVGLPAAWGAS